MNILVNNKIVKHPMLAIFTKSMVKVFLKAAYVIGT